VSPREPPIRRELKTDACARCPHRPERHAQLSDRTGRSEGRARYWPAAGIAGCPSPHQLAILTAGQRWGANDR
jgi:hypothetical protein